MAAELTADPATAAIGRNLDRYPRVARRFSSSQIFQYHARGLIIL